MTPNEPLIEADQRCSCGNRFDGDNLCMVSACQWEGIEPEPRGEAVEHRITTTHSAFGHGWYCSCGVRGRGDMAPTERAAYGYGERHVRHALRITSPKQEGDLS